MKAKYKLSCRVYDKHKVIAYLDGGKTFTALEVHEMRDQAMKRIKELGEVVKGMDENTDNSFKPEEDTSRHPGKHWEVGSPTPEPRCFKMYERCHGAARNCNTCNHLNACQQGE